MTQKIKPSKLILLIIILIILCILSPLPTNSLSLKFFQTLKAISNLVNDQKEMRNQLSFVDQKTNKTLNYLSSNYTQLQSFFTKEIQNEFLNYTETLNKKIDFLITSYEKIYNKTISNTNKISEFENKLEKSAANKFRSFRIISANNSKCLTDTGKGNQISLQECKSDFSNPAQAWKISPSAEGWYTIISSNNKSIDVNNGKKFSGNFVQTWDLNLGEAQRWALDPVGDFFYIRSFGFGCLRLDFDQNTSQVGIFECKEEEKDKDNKQKFFFTVYN